MSGFTTDFAGAERHFRLGFGEILDLEEACGKVGFGAIFVRLSTHAYHAGDVRHVLRYGLRGGGTPLAEATRLVDERMPVAGLTYLHGIAIEVMLSVLEGVPENSDGPAEVNDPEKPMDAGAIFAGFAQMGIPPEQVRAMRWSDFVAMMRAMGGKQVSAPTEEEFKDMIARFGETHVG